MRRVRLRYLLPAALGAAAVGLATAGLLSGQATPIPGLGDRDGCAAYTGLPPQWRSSPTAGMAPVRLDDGRQLWFDVTEVTTAQFADFVAATGYVTELERGAGAGAVFAAPTSATVELGPHVWWQPRPDASWRQPRGADGPPAAPNEPVTMVTRADAEAYAAWLGRRLPTEAEWEAGARGSGRDDGLDERGRPIANFWQGLFPHRDLAEDGFHGLAPVGCYPANAQGLFDTVGNVWEWTGDDWGGESQWHGHGEVPVEAAGGTATAGLIKGGSWLCAANYCQRYRRQARHRHDIHVGTVHVGFRTVRDAP